jgi:dolichol-phosphate mannosyltransferase
MNLIVVPTYEEALIIGGLLDNMVGEPTLGGFHVLVVDDTRPDGTPNVVPAHPDHGIGVHLLNRLGKSGLGPAYRAGFAHGPATTGTTSSCRWTPTDHTRSTRSRAT